MEVPAHHYNLKRYPGIWRVLDEIFDDGLMQTCHLAMIEAVRPFKVEPISISYTMS